MKLLISSTISKTSALLLCGVFAAQAVFAETAQVNPSIPGVGVVVKKNPGSGASKVTTDEGGCASVKLTQGSYSISLDQATLLRTGTSLAKKADPKSSYIFNGDGTQIAITPDKGINVTAGAAKGPENVVNVIVSSPKATLKLSIKWEPAVMKQGTKAPGYIGHVTLLK